MRRLQRKKRSFREGIAFGRGRTIGVVTGTRKNIDVIFS
jgi:hypothetical protein